MKVTVIAGRFDDGQAQQIGAVEKAGHRAALLRPATPAGGRIAPRLPDGHRVLLYVYEGSLTVKANARWKSPPIAWLGCPKKGELSLRSEAGARVLGARRQAVTRADRPVRSVRDEQPRGNLAGATATIATVSWPSEPCASRPSGRFFPSACPVLNKVYRSIRRKRSSSARLPIASW
ncbi:hypothetical protein ACPA9J_32305 [Pseudomonas aeruginosa]